MNTISKIIALAITVLGGAVLPAQVTKQGAGYLFRLKFSKGQSYKYQMNMSGSGQGQTFIMRMPMTMTVVGVSGVVGTVTYKIGPVSMSVGGKTTNMPNVRTMTLKLDNRGNVVSGADASQVQGMGTIGLPARPMAIGSTWSAKTKTAAGAAGQMDVQATYRFVGIERQGGINSAKISMTMTGAGQANVKGSGTMWLAVSDGALVRTDTTMTVNMQGTTMPMSLSIVRK